MTEDQLILVDEKDAQIGICGKMETHERALLHRAFSIFLFRDEELLIQQRSLKKYHCGGLWANTCCSHPRNGEPLEDGIFRRLMDETGIDGAKCHLREVGSFIYKAEFENGLTEHEFDHVIVGEYDGPFHRNPEEADDMKYVSLSWLERDIKENDKKYAYWFVKALPIALAGRGKGEK